MAIMDASAIFFTHSKCVNSKIHGSERSTTKINQNKNIERNGKQNPLSNGQGGCITPYEMVRPKNESYLLNQLRRWELHMGFETPLIWSSAIAIIIFHIVATSTTLYAFITHQPPMWQSCLFGLFMGGVAGFGVTAGAHRYWCHRSYKAKKPLQIILLLCYSVAGQNNIFNWVRDHRVHHKFSETSADPHDANRGFFFAHVGWLMMKKHPEVIRRGNQIDMSDITADPLVQFHKKYFNVFKAIFCFIVPTMIPVYCWNEYWWNGIISQALFRYMLSLNFTWSVNSFAHMWGNKPYDRNIMPVENWSVSMVAMGEGWHNYHHTFPWDYKAAELGDYSLNITTLFLDMFRYIGWAYDFKQASPALIRAVADRRGKTGENKQ